MAERTRFGNRLDQCGQMTVELAVCIPVLLAVVGVAINLMVFLGDCARFDRLAAEAVRLEAASPGLWQLWLPPPPRGQSQGGSQSLLGSCFASAGLPVSAGAGISGTVDGSTGTAGGEATGGGQNVYQENNRRTTFSLEPHHETYVCSLNYRPWGFGDSFFGIRFSGITHTRSYTIDPFRPGVLL